MPQAVIRLLIALVMHDLFFLFYSFILILMRNPSLKVCLQGIRARVSFLIKVNIKYASALVQAFLSDTKLVDSLYYITV